MQTKVKAICKTCYFWLHLEEDYGICRRNPPTVFEDTLHHDTYSAWPDTDEYSWCGEYMRKPFIAEGEDDE